MKKLLSIFILFFTLSLSAQYTIVSAVDLNEGMEEQYLKLEEFFSPIHKLAIEKGIQNFQAVFKVVESNDEGENSADYFIITGFNTKEELDAYNNSWSADDWLNLAYEAHKGKLSRSSVRKYMNSVGSESKERRNYHIKNIDQTIWAGGDLKPGERMSITSTIAKSEDFESWESEIIKPLVNKEIMMGQHRWWALSKIYERTENAYEGITHFFFNIGIPGATRTGWDDLGKTFKGQKLREGVQSASEHQNYGLLELVSINN